VVRKDNFGGPLISAVLHESKVSLQLEMKFSVFQAGISTAIT